MRNLKIRGTKKQQTNNQGERLHRFRKEMRFLKGSRLRKEGRRGVIHRGEVPFMREGTEKKAKKKHGTEGEKKIQVWKTQKGGGAKR